MICLLLRGHVIVSLISRFDLNTNLVPHTYILKPSSQAQQGKWWDIFERLQTTLRKASRCLKDKERYYCAIFPSIKTS